MIDLSVKPLINDESIQCANLIAKIDSDAEWEDPNEIKVVQDMAGYALYFSREPIPSSKKGKGRYFNRWKQVCIIPFRREFLLKFIKMPQTPLEIVESIDMLRALEHGIKVRLVESPFKTYSVDTEQDRLRVEKVMKKDELFGKYRKVSY
jgi:3-deoxy-manno-octulosonate cytidylyltransferase (CMP-KDO synthetase)